MDDLETEIGELLRTPDVWQVAQTPSQRAGEIVSLAQSLAEEKRQAAAFVESLATTPPAWWRTTVAKSPIGRSIGTVECLLAWMRTELSKSPARALEITSLAVEITNSLSLADYAGDFVITARADAWRDHAFVLQFLGRFREAVAALDEAEHLQRETFVSEYGLARIMLVRANIFTATDKRQEAIDLAADAAKIFLQFGDRPKYAAARITQAVMLHEHGAVREALAIWDSIKNEEALDELNRILVIYNLGLAYREVGEMAKSIEHITVVIAEYELLGMSTEATRARWALATTLVSAGKLTAALPLFDRAWKEFETLGLESDAALVALELAETLVVLGQPERVTYICRMLFDRFTRAGMTSRAITALAYLREVVALGKVQAPVVRQVREFLRDLPLQGRPALSLPFRDPER